MVTERESSYSGALKDRESLQSIASDGATCLAARLHKRCSIHPLTPLGGDASNYDSERWGNGYNIIGERGEPKS